MSKASVAQEPSMDEILASIRRIIETSDEKTGGANREAAVGAARQIPAFLAGAPMREIAEPQGRAVDDVPSEAAAPLRFPAEPVQREHAPSAPIGDDDMLTAELETELAATWERIEVGREPEGMSSPAVADDSMARSEPMSSEPEARPFAGQAGAYSYSHGPEPVQTAAPEPAYNPATYEAPMERSAFEPANTDARGPEEPMATSSRYGDTPPPLVSPATGQLVGASFNELAEAIRQGELRSLEAMAQEMLQPMLRDWLDDNLPQMVERLIREEIERLARGGTKR